MDIVITIENRDYIQYLKNIGIKKYTLFTEDGEDGWKTDSIEDIHKIKSKYIRLSNMTNDKMGIISQYFSISCSSVSFGENWELTGNNIYNPSVMDYQVSGYPYYKIKEIPITTIPFPYRKQIDLTISPEEFNLYIDNIFYLNFAVINILNYNDNVKNNLETLLKYAEFKELCDL